MQTGRLMRMPVYIHISKNKRKHTFLQNGYGSDPNSETSTSACSFSSFSCFSDCFTNSLSTVMDIKFCLGTKNGCVGSLLMRDMSRENSIGLDMILHLSVIVKTIDESESD